MPLDKKDRVIRCCRGVGGAFLAHLKPTVYLAHPWDTRNSKSIKDIIKKLEERGFRIFNPFEEEKDLEKKYGGEYYDVPSRSFAREIRVKDLDSIKRCDYYFAFIPSDKPTIGTVREYDYATRIGKYKIVISHWPNPWVEEAEELYLTIEDFLKDNPYEWKE